MNLFFVDRLFLTTFILSPSKYQGLFTFPLRKKKSFPFSFDLVVDLLYFQT